MHWVANDGVRYKAGANFVLPPVEWKSRSGSVQLTATASSSENWPPATTNQLVILATPTGPNVGQSVTETWSGEWTCGTEGRSNITVPAGRFDVVKIACERTGGDPGRPQRRVWYYSPRYPSLRTQGRNNCCRRPAVGCRPDSRSARPRHMVPVGTQRFQLGYTETARARRGWPNGCVGHWRQWDRVRYRAYWPNEDRGRRDLPPLQAGSQEARPARVHSRLSPAGMMLRDNGRFQALKKGRFCRPMFLPQGNVFLLTKLQWTDK